MSEPRELMVILALERPTDDPSGKYRVTQKVSPRVLIIEPSYGSTREKLEATEGVLAVLAPGETAPDDVRRLLTDSEALFVDAFRLRARHKDRPGEGLAWDAEGFLPPDPPKNR